MKIGLVVPGGVDRSGEIRVIPVLLALIARLSARHEVHVFALHQEERPDTWDLAGARIHNIGTHNTRLRAIGAIRAEHRASPFQVIHSIWSGSPGLVAVAAAVSLGVRSIVHVAGGELIAIRDIPYGGRLTWTGRLREALVLRSATRVCAASTPMTDLLKALGIAATRLPLGVDLTVWHPQEPVRRDTGSVPRLIHVASLNPIKDQATLIRALAALSASGIAFEMDIVGEDTLNGEIQSLCARHGLTDRVHFHGFLTQQRLLPIVRAAHLMMFTSRHEAGPLAVLEAGACGVPTAGTSVGHIAEWAPAAAIAVPVQDWQALANATARLLQDEELRLRVAREAMTRACKEDADYTAQRVHALYEELVP